MPAAGAIAKAALAHERDRAAVMLLDERLGADADLAAGGGDRGGASLGAAGGPASWHPCTGSNLEKIAAAPRIEVSAQQAQKRCRCSRDGIPRPILGIRARQHIETTQHIEKTGKRDRK